MSASGPAPAMALGTTPAAAKPVILVVDDDLPVLAAVVRDLRHSYGDRYRIVQASDSRSALAALEELALGDGAVALIVADQRMPAMSGVEPGFVLTGPELARPKTWQERREPFPSRPACPASSRPETSARSR